MCVCAHVSSLFLCIYLGMKLLVHMMTLTFWVTINCFWKSLHHIVFPPEKYEVPNFSTSIPTLVIVSLFDYRRAWTLRFFFFFFFLVWYQDIEKYTVMGGPVGLVPPLRHDKPYYGLIFVIVFHSHSLSHMETKFSLSSKPCMKMTSEPLGYLFPHKRESISLVVRALLFN